jgi:hypothetical protein
MKFTFKTERPTGKWKSFDVNRHLIKFNKKECGSISETFSLTPIFKIHLTVEKQDIMEDKNPNCTWKGIKFKKEFSSLREAKDFLNENIDAIMENYKLHLFE